MIVIKKQLIINNMETNQFEHRLAMIQDDLKALRVFIAENNLEAQFNLPTAQCERAISHLNNIEIACDITSDESLSWKLFTSTNK
jgi:hypothetical protein